MIIIAEVLVSNAVLQRKFACELTACKGACCWEGDFGAPLEEDEVTTLDQLYDRISPYMQEEGRRVVDQVGTSIIYPHDLSPGTPLIANGACVYMTYDELGIARCAIEAAYRAGDIQYIKPISCHLYPIRVTHRPELGFEALNYDEWDICSAACARGEAERIPVYQFVKTALVRKYGTEFYEELEAAAEALHPSGRE